MKDEDLRSTSKTRLKKYERPEVITRILDSKRKDAAELRKTQWDTICLEASISAANTSFLLHTSSHGRKPEFRTSEALRRACDEYFIKSYKNPLVEYKSSLRASQKPKDVVTKVRPLSIAGLCLFLDITRHRWEKYKKDDFFSDEAKRAEMIISTQKFEGAAVGIFNSQIIAKDIDMSAVEDIVEPLTKIVRTFLDDPKELKELKELKEPKEPKEPKELKDE